MRYRFLRSKFGSDDWIELLGVGVHGIPEGDVRNWERLREQLRQGESWDRPPAWLPSLFRPRPTYLFGVKRLALERTKHGFSVYNPHNRRRASDVFELSLYEVPEFLAALEEALNPPPAPMFVSEHVN